MVSSCCGAWGREWWYRGRAGPAETSRDEMMSRPVRQSGCGVGAGKEGREVKAANTNA